MAQSSRIEVDPEVEKRLREEATANKLSNDINELGRDFDPGSDEDREPTSYRTCYNRGCADYRVQRPGHVACQCEREKRPVKGAGSSPGWF